MDENEDKIVGGDIVNDISERPFQVALETDFGFQFCGSIILTLFLNEFQFYLSHQYIIVFGFRRIYNR